MINSKYKLKVTGKNPKNFIRFLHKLHIEMLSIQYNEDHCIILVDKENYEKICKMKTSYKIEVVNRYGFTKIKYLLKKYFLFCILLLVGYFLLLLLSNLIFEVEVIHSKQEIRKLVLEELEQQGISKLKWKVSFQKQEEIVDIILAEHKDKLEWLEIENIGTKYIVKVEERKLNEEKEDKLPQDVIAKKDGVILKIEASSGTVVKKKNDYVKKGDVIITGVIKNQDTLMKLVPAQGVVQAETWYQSTVEMPLQYKESYLTQEKKTVLQISFLNKKFSLFDFSSFKHAKEDITYIIKHPLFPFSIQKVKQQKMTVIDEIYTREEAVIKASELAREKLEKRLGVNDEIISEKTLKIIEKESKIIVEIFFKVKEDITDTQIIDETKVDIKEET